MIKEKRSRAAKVHISRWGTGQHPTTALCKRTIEPGKYVSLYNAHDIVARYRDDPELLEKTFCKRCKQRFDAR